MKGGLYMEAYKKITFICEVPSAIPIKTLKAMDVELSRFLGVQIEYTLKKAEESMFGTHGFNIAKGDFFLLINTKDFSDKWNNDTVEIAIAVMKKHMDMSIFGELQTVGEEERKEEVIKITDEEYNRMIKDLGKNSKGKHV